MGKNDVELLLDAIRLLKPFGDVFGCPIGWSVVHENRPRLRAESLLKPLGDLPAPPRGFRAPKLNDPSLGFREGFFGGFAFEGVDTDRRSGTTNQLRIAVNGRGAARGALVEPDDQNASLNRIADVGIKVSVVRGVENDGGRLAGGGLGELFALGVRVIGGIERGDFVSLLRADLGAQQIALKDAEGPFPGGLQENDSGSLVIHANTECADEFWRTRDDLVVRRLAFLKVELVFGDCGFGTLLRWAACDQKGGQQEAGETKWVGWHGVGWKDCFF